MDAALKLAFETRADKQGRDRMRAMHFIQGADRDLYGNLIDDLHHQYLKNKWNEYPKNLQDTYVLLKGWNKKKTQHKQPVGVAFTNLGDDDEEGTALVNKGKGSYSGPPCARCNRDNHPTDKCHAKTRADGTLLHVEGVKYEYDDVSTDHEYGFLSSDDYSLMFIHNSDDRMDQTAVSNKGPIPSTWMLLDSQSTIDVFSNRDMLRDIHPTKTTMHIKCNAGSRSTNLRGYLSGYGWVWFFPNGIANILSLSRVKEKFRVTFDSASDNCFHVHKKDRVLKF
jgi:hypothetical protein